MSIDAQRLKATGNAVGKPCAWCGLLLARGEEAAVCIACDALHHAECWKKYAGCGFSGCMNEPVTRRDAPAGARKMLPPEKIYCPRCGGVIARDQHACPHCKSRLGDPVGVRPRSERAFNRITVQEATSALVYGITGLVILGFIFGPLAIVNGRNALRRIQTNRRKGDDLYTGGDLARAGLFLGIFATVLHLSLLALYVLALFYPEQINPYLPVKVPEGLLEQILDTVLGDWRFQRAG